MFAFISFHLFFCYSKKSNRKAKTKQQQQNVFFAISILFYMFNIITTAKSSRVAIELDKYLFD